MKRVKLTYTDLFILVSLLTLVSSFIMWICGLGNINQSVLSPEPIFCDFFYHVGYASAGADLYSVSDKVCFPPLAYCLYYLVWKMNPAPATIDPGDWEAFRGYENNLLILVLYSIVSAILLVECVRAYMRDSGQGRKTLIVSLLIICSYPFMGAAIQRGNMIVITSVLIAYSFLWIDSDNAVKRELALVFLAIASCLKIAPAFLGLYYLFDKRYKEFARLVIYTIILFFGPFVFFGGMEGIREFFNNVMTLAGKQDEYSWNTVYGFVSRVVDGKVSQAHKEILAAFSRQAFLVICTICAWMTGDKWKRIFFLCMVPVSYVSSNYVYTLTYFLAPAVLFLKEEGAGEAKRLIPSLVALGFGLVFSLPSWMNYVFADGIREGMFVILFPATALMAVWTIYRFFVSHKGRLM